MMNATMNRISCRSQQIRWQHSSRICVEKIHSVIPRTEKDWFDIEHKEKEWGN